MRSLFPRGPASPRHKVKQRGKTTMAVAIFPALESSSPQVTNYSLPVHTGLDAPEGRCRCTDLHSLWGCPVAGEFSLYCALPPSAYPMRNVWLLVLSTWVPWDPRHCATGPGLPGTTSPEGNGAQLPLLGISLPNQLASPKYPRGPWHSSPLPISDCCLWCVFPWLPLLF